MEDYQVQKLVPAQIDRILALQDLVLASMPKPEYYVAASRQELCAVMERDVVFGILDGEEPIAVAICIGNRDCPENLGKKWGEEPSAAFTFDGVFSHPDHRGKGLQMKLIEAAKQTAQQMGAASMWCTVAPDNLFSYRNFTKAGFAPVVKGAVMYGGRTRDVLKMPL